jgi:hypothetical protein
MHHPAIPSILTGAESTAPNTQPSRRCVVAAFADVIQLSGPNGHAIQYRTTLVHPRARQLSLRKAFKYLDTDFLRERALDLTHAIPEPDYFPLLLDVHWSPPKNDQ